MKWSKQKRVWVVLLLLVTITEGFKNFPEFIEHKYAQGLYPAIGTFFRMIFGWLPYSVGDFLVAILICYMLYLVAKGIYSWTKKGFDGKACLSALGGLVKSGLAAYVIFNFLWGFNYYRLGSSYLLGIDPVPYHTSEVDTLVAVLQKKLHAISRDSFRIEASKTNNRKLLSEIAFQSYQNASNRYPFLAFERQSLKPNLIGKLQSYTGYAGYMFPFTGEAHVNFYAPAYSLPFSVCHEMAHQLGFGAESEANLIGFLTARSSSNKAFEYSAYTGVHSYALRELYFRDTLKAKAYHDNMPLILKKDRLEMKRFLEAHKSFLQPGLDVAYNFYLLSQNQEQGLASYNYVVAWLIAYGKKFGWEQI